MQAIQTQYRGYNFRSRLEARWAVFFDALKLKWEYEHQGFVLSDGTRYLPDFKVDGYYAEVKPSDDADISKPLRFAANGTSILVLTGVPSMRPVMSIDIHGIGTASFVPPGKYSPIYYCPDETAAGDINEEWLRDDIAMAVIAARSARFEHGESGATL